MEHKFIFVNAGSSNQGKSDSIRRLYKILERQADHVERLIEEEYDVCAILWINGVRIGIESQGDPPYYRSLDSLEKFKDYGCDVIICAARSYGYTYDAPFALEESGYICCLLTNGKSNKQELQKLMNQMWAENVANLINKIIDGENPIEESLSE